MLTHLVLVSQLYTVSYNYCTSSRMNSGGVSEVGGNRSGANLMGSDLYKHLNHYFVSHLKTVRAAAEDLSDEPLLNYYTKEWDRYTTGASYVNRLFTYLNRHWVKREKDEGRKNVYTVYILALVQWKDHFYKHVSRFWLRATPLGFQSRPAAARLLTRTSGPSIFRSKKPRERVCGGAVSSRAAVS